MMKHPIFFDDMMSKTEEMDVFVESSNATTFMYLPRNESIPFHLFPLLVSSTLPQWEQETPEVNVQSQGYLDNLMIGLPMAFCLYFLSVLTSVGNAMVLHAIRTERRLQTVSNMFIMSLAIADLTVGLIVMPISSTYVLMGRWQFGLVVCQFWLAADYSASTASILNLLILSLDRYWSISEPLKYMRRRSKRRALVMIGFVWVGSGLWIVPIIGWHVFVRGGVRKQPPDVCETEFADSVSFKLTTSTLNFYAPMLAMIGTYCRIYLEIKKRSLLEIGQCNVGGGSTLSRSNSSTPLSGSAKGSDGSDLNLRQCRYMVSASFRAKEDGRKENKRGPLTADDRKRRRKCSKGVEQRDSKISADRATIVVRSPSDQDKLSCAQPLKKEEENDLESANDAEADDRLHERRRRLVPSHRQRSEQSTDGSCRGRCDPHRFGVTSDTRWRCNMCGDGREPVRWSRNRDSRESERVSFEVGDNEAEVSGEWNGPSVELRLTPKEELVVLSSEEPLKGKRRLFRTCLSTDGDSRKGKFEEVCCDPISENGSTATPATAHLQVPLVQKPRPEESKRTLDPPEPSSRTSSFRILHNFPTLRLRRRNINTLRQEKKAARQLGVIIGAFVLCWLPYIVIFMVTAICDDCLDPAIHTAAIWLGYLNSTVNPMIYALCNANFRRAFGKIGARISSGWSSRFSRRRDDSNRSENNPFA